MRAQQIRSMTRADIQAALMGCALVSGTAIAVSCVWCFLPGIAVFPVTVGVATFFCAAAVCCAGRLFCRISNPSRRELANVDRLTGLKSRSAFEVDMQNIHARQSWRSAGLLVVDLDRLKAVNDTLGHTAGDEYLRNAADALWKESDGALCPYRVGGDEFAILCRETTEEALSALGARILARFDLEKPAWAVKISLSLGWAAFEPERDHNLYDTYRRADARMYAHKREHRN